MQFCEAPIDGNLSFYLAMLYYEDQKEEALRKAKDFRETRIPKYFNHFEAVLSANKEKNGELWLVGSSLTYADLGLFHLVEGVSHLSIFLIPNINMMKRAPNSCYLHSQRRPLVSLKAIRMSPNCICASRNVRVSQSISKAIDANPSRMVFIGSIPS